MHVHIGLQTALSVFAMVLLVGTLWRVAAMKLSNTAIGQAMALMY